MPVTLAQESFTWNTYFETQPHTEFLQSWEWGEFQRQMGREPMRFCYEKNGNVEGQMQGFVHSLPMGVKYLYCPRVSVSNNVEAIDEFLNEIKKQHFSFVRLEFASFKFQVSSFKFPISEIRNRQPRQTLIIDLTKTDEELLSAMHQKTRYNIHLAKRNGVAVKEEKNADIFWRLHGETIERGKFRGHDRRYYDTMLEMESVRQLIAYHDNQPIASNILIHFGDTMTYLHGASGSGARNVMAPYLLQWEGIKLGRRLGKRCYDFWGVAPAVEPSNNTDTQCSNGFCWPSQHPWSGVTRFKVGFGGSVRAYPQAFDIVFGRKRYMLYELGQRARQLFAPNNNFFAPKRPL